MLNVLIMPDRIKKINSLLLEEINKLILQEVEFPPDTLVTITGISTSKDLHYAKVFLSVLPLDQKDRVLKHLKNSNIQSQLFKKITTKFVPKLQFYIDDTGAKAQDIEKLLDQIQKKA